MTGKEINEARRINRIYEQSEKDEVFQKLIHCYGEAVFKIDQLKIENEILKEEKKMLFQMLETAREEGMPSTEEERK